MDKIIVSNWLELCKVESPTHIIDVNLEVGNGWIRPKGSNKGKAYLTTHTFYEESINSSNWLLDKFNFNAIIINKEGK